MIGCFWPLRSNTKQGLKRRQVWFAYSRWTKDATEIVYHAGRKLYLYKRVDGSTENVSNNDKADYRYPHGEAAPK